MVIDLVAVLLLSIIVLEAPRAAAPSGTYEPVLTNLNFPTAIAFAPDGRIFFIERFSGNIRIAENGSVLPTPFYTLADVATSGEQGLLGLALDPSFATDPWVYAYYTLNDAANSTVYNRVVRIHADGDLGDAIEILLDRIPAGFIHVGGVIGFAPDATLYAVVGETGDPSKSQDLHSLSGKVLRMNRNGSVPDDNPFVGNDSANPYVYTYGHRNMFGLAFHPVTGRAYVPENGPECNDEVNLLIPGRNFGWGPHETCGTPPPPPNNTNQDGPDPVLPLVWFTPTVAPTNAVAYGGPYFPAWQGDLFMGEWNTRNLLRLDLEPPNYDEVVGQEVVLTAPNGIVEVEAGPDGAIWFTTPTTLYRFYDTSRAPTPSFTSSPVKPLAGTPVTFDASASRDPDGTIVSYDWDFGDGATDSGEVVTHAYGAFGSYSVSLTLTDDDNLTATSTRAVRIFALPIASFFIEPPEPLEGVPATFDGSGSSDPDGTIATYDWTWGDGTDLTTSQPTAEHAFDVWGTYQVTLTVIDADGLQSTLEAAVRVVAPPTASFAIATFAPRAGEPVSFDASSSSDSDGTIAAYDWTFGDGSGGSGVTVSHVYDANGNYLVSLVVTDSDGLMGTASRSVAVGIANQPPVASFTVTPSKVYPGDRLRFDASASSDPDGVIASYAWDFGDSGSEVGQVAFHTYAAKGTYLVTLTIVDEDGASALDTDSLVVSNRVPIVLSAVPFVNTVGLVVGADQTFTVTAQDPDGDPLAITWRLDGTVVATEGASFTFHASQPGSFVLNVTISDGTDAADRQWTIVVEATSGPSGFLTGYGLIFVASVLGLAAIAALALWMRRRRKG